MALALVVQQATHRPYEHELATLVTGPLGLTQTSLPQTEDLPDAQFRFRAGSSEPPGPGTDEAGLAIFRYTTRCGTVYGHTGNTRGFTQFAASTEDGSRSVVVQVNGQITPGNARGAFAQLLVVQTSAVCAALTG